MTIEIPADITGISAQLDWLQAQTKYVALPSRYGVKGLPKNPTAQDYRDVAEELERYEKTYAEAKKLEEENIPHNKSVQQAIHDLIEDASGLKDLNIPDWQKSKIRRLAYDHNNGSGYLNYCQILQDFVNLFIEN